MKLQSVLVLLLSTSVLGSPSTVTEDDANLGLPNHNDKVEEGDTEMDTPMKEAEAISEKDKTGGFTGYFKGLYKGFSEGWNIQNVTIDKVEEGVTESNLTMKEVEVSNEKDDSEGLEILNNVIKGLTKGSNIQSAILDKVKESVVKIDKLMKDVEVRLTKITKEIGVMNTERSASLRDAHKTYRGIKVTLKDIRVELKRLVVQAELKLSDILFYVKHWDHEKCSIQEQKEYLKEIVNIVKLLLKESNDILADIETKYNQAYMDFSNLEIIEWQESLKHADSHIDEATEENFYTLTLKMPQYETLARQLDAAREIIGQLNNSFGENILDKNLADPNNRDKEQKERATLRAKPSAPKVVKNAGKKFENADDD